jgi:hypothetical protein
MVRANQAELLYPASGTLYLNEQLRCHARLRGALELGTQPLPFQQLGSSSTRSSNVFESYISDDNNLVTNRVCSRRTV